MGGPEYISIYQPAFEQELDRLAKAEGSVEVFQGETVTAIAQDGESVAATAVNDSGLSRQIRGRYLIGADGGNSVVREALGVAYESLGFDQDWLVIDARIKHERPNLPPMRQYCEPEQPGVTLRMGPHHRRWTFMIFPGESREEAVKPENVWRRLTGPTVRRRTKWNSCESFPTDSSRSMPNVGAWGVLLESHGGSS